jgi:hypothetical protein
MAQSNLIIVMSLGGFFVLLGLAAIIWGSREERGYYNSISTRVDVREFLERRPRRPEPEALKIGGWIAIAVGLLMLAMGGGFWLWG